MITTMIFDGEGVVIDTEWLWDEESRLFLERRGIIYERDKIKHLLTGKSLKEGAAVLKNEFGLDGNLDDLAQERIKTMRGLLNGVQFMPGFEEFFGRITDRKVCIATSMDRGLLSLVDRRLGLTKMFQGHIYSISDIGNVSKPAPDIFLHAAKNVNADPEECVVIEDAPYGIEAAKAAGMRCIAITTTYRRELLGQADLIVESFEEINPNDPF